MCIHNYIFPYDAVVTSSILEMDILLGIKSFKIKAHFSHEVFAIMEKVEDNFKRIICHNFQCVLIIKYSVVWRNVVKP